MGCVPISPCKICERPSQQIFRRMVLEKHEVAYFQCTSCGFIQTEEPFWLGEAYRSSLNIEDTGLVDRNLLSAKRTAVILGCLFNSRGRFVDFGGGSGLFVRLMRDAGFDFFWLDPISSNLFARGFEFDPSNRTPIEAVTSMECFEHFTDPLNEIEKMLLLSSAILFSTEIFASRAPDPDQWDYYRFSHGQHVSLYSLTSLRAIAQKYHLHLYSNRKSFHLLTKKKTSNALFNLLLKGAVLGLQPVITAALGSKIKADSLRVRQR